MGGWVGVGVSACCGVDRERGRWVGGRRGRTARTTAQNQPGAPLRPPPPPPPPPHLVVVHGRLDHGLDRLVDELAEGALAGGSARLLRGGGGGGACVRACGRGTWGGPTRACACARPPIHTHPLPPHPSTHPPTPHPPIHSLHTHLLAPLLGGGVKEVVAPQLLHHLLLLHPKLLGVELGEDGEREGPAVQASGEGDGALGGGRGGVGATVGGRGRGGSAYTG